MNTPNTTEDPHTTEIGGHRTIDTGKRKAGQIVRSCLDCDKTGDYILFDVGTRGCPMRPESLDYLSVCPGGDRCDGHMDTSTEDYRTWKASKSMPSDLVPRFTCLAEKLGVRAARQWLKFADKIGLKMSVWAQTPIADRVGAGGGTVAELTHQGRPYHVAVTRYGKLSAHRGNEFECPACGSLKEKGDIAT